MEKSGTTKRGRVRLAAWLMALAMALSLLPPAARAAPAGVYFTAVNEKLQRLTGDTMPFWSGGTLYVSSRLFEGTDAGVTYVRNTSMGLAMLYASSIDLRFDLENQTVYDRQGVYYSGYAIERGGVVFFPLALVCRYFGLTWTYTNTTVAPLIRVKSASVILDDSSFIDAATGLMNNYYNEYLRSLPVESNPSVSPPVEQGPGGDSTPPTDGDVIQAAAGQKAYLIIDSRSAEDTFAVMERLGTAQATFLLTVEQMEDGNLLRGLVAGGHGVALQALDETAEEVKSEIDRARERLWQSACMWLELVWYGGEADVENTLRACGCVRITATLDRSRSGLAGSGQANTLLRSIGRYRSDLGVFLGSDSACLPGLPALLRGLRQGRYHLCAWRLTA